MGHVPIPIPSVLLVTNPELQALPLASIINDAAQPHPSGTDINDNGTIYWVSNGTRHPYSSLDVFNSWHKDGSFANVVTANATDLALPIDTAVIARVIG